MWKRLSVVEADYVSGYPDRLLTSSRSVKGEWEALLLGRLTGPSRHPPASLHWSSQRMCTSMLRTLAQRVCFRGVNDVVRE